MTIDNEVQMAATNPHQYLQCSLLRTQAAGLHVRVVPLLDTTTFDVTIEALQGLGKVVSLGVSAW